MKLDLKLTLCAKSFFKRKFKKEIQRKLIVTKLSYRLFSKYYKRIAYEKLSAKCIYR